jgi:hypothetical protein
MIHPHLKRKLGVCHLRSNHSSVRLSHWHECTTTKWLMKSVPCRASRGESTSFILLNLPPPPPQHRTITSVIPPSTFWLRPPSHCGRQTN